MSTKVRRFDKHQIKKQYIKIQNLSTKVRRVQKHLIKKTAPNKIINWKTTLQNNELKTTLPLTITTYHVMMMVDVYTHTQTRQIDE